MLKPKPEFLEERYALFQRSRPSVFGLPL